jgi:hypothetical protein
MAISYLSGQAGNVEGVELYAALSKKRRLNVPRYKEVANIYFQTFQQRQCSQAAALTSIQRLKGNARLSATLCLSTCAIADGLVWCPVLLT